MKNIYKLISILLIAVMLLCSCSTVVETQTPLPPTEVPISLPTYITSVDDIGRIVYPLENDIDIYTQFEQNKNSDGSKINHLLNRKMTIEEDVPKKITWNLQGVEFNFEYKWSTTFVWNRILSDAYIDYYKDVDNGYEIAFKHGTTQPIHFQFWDNKLFNWRFDTLTQYTDFIKNEILDSSVDLERYEMTCITEWETADGKEMTTESFYTVGDGEILKGYDFRYVTKNGSNDTGNIITVSFSYTIYDTALLVFCNESSNYTYDEIIPVSQNELDYAKELVDAYVGGEDFGRRTETKFLMLDVLYGRKYLVYEFEHEEHGGDEIQRIYVDYERLQQKMALEGRI